MRILNARVIIIKISRQNIVLLCCNSGASALLDRCFSSSVHAGKRKPTQTFDSKVSATRIIFNSPCLVLPNIRITYALAIDYFTSLILANLVTTL